MNSDKKTKIAIYIAICLAMMTFLFMAFAANALIDISKERCTEAEYIFVNSCPTEQTTQEDTEVQNEVEFVIKDYMGKVAIFSEDKLIEVIDVYTKTLPEADRIMLSDGITVRSIKQLNSIIEDYSN